jgi:hypothetical protein
VFLCCCQELFFPAPCMRYCSYWHIMLWLLQRSRCWYCCSDVSWDYEFWRQQCHGEQTYYIAFHVNYPARAWIFTKHALMSYFWQGDDIKKLRFDVLKQVRCRQRICKIASDLFLFFM